MKFVTSGCSCFAESACNAGYFPVSLSRRGAREAVEADDVAGDASEVVAWLNACRGTRSVSTAGTIRDCSGCLGPRTLRCGSSSLMVPTGFKEPSPAPGVSRFDL